jgi:Ring finger domain
MERSFEDDGAVLAPAGLRRRRPPQQPSAAPPYHHHQQVQQQPPPHLFAREGDERFAEEEPSPSNSSRLQLSPSQGTVAESPALPAATVTARGELPIAPGQSQTPRRGQGPQDGGPGQPNTIPPADGNDNNPHRALRQHQNRRRPPSPHRLARLYCLFSLLLALAAVVTPPSSQSTSTAPIKNGAKSRGISSSKGGTSSGAGSLSSQPLSTSASDFQEVWSWLDFWPFRSWDDYRVVDSNGVKKQGHRPDASPQQQHPSQENSNWLMDVVAFFSPKQEPEPAPKAAAATTTTTNPILSSRLVKWLLSNLDGESYVLVWRYTSWLVEELIDPILLERPLSPTTLTDLLDKILTSTIRLLALANLLLSWTYILQTAVADWFLDPSQYGGGTSHTRNAFATAIGAGTAPADPAIPRRHHHHHQPPNSQQQPHRLLGGFLVFKMLLVSAVVAPDTLDWMILLSWYTLLSFLRSLSRTCATVTERSGMLSGTQPPPSGVWQLLSVVLVCDILAAAMCVALFHGAGWAMVVLLTCDCALLGVEVVSNLLEYVVQWLETQHIHQVQELERGGADERPASGEWVHLNDDEGRVDAPSPPPSPPPSPSPLRLDPINTQRLEVLERQHTRRLQVLETTIFALQLTAQLLTCAHFVHIWTLHGVQFSLIDGVLALHLHSAITTLGQKIQERRNVRRIARDLDGMFATATPTELRKAAVAGDVCCICLCSMTVNVKKVACGHLYHTGCLREVVERARSIEAARCPLCRSSLLHGRRNQQRGTNAPPGVQLPTAPPMEAQQPLRVAGGNGERPLFRFSTEEVFPEWLPLPAFAFEVVRRPSATVVAPTNPEQRQAEAPVVNPDAAGQAEQRQNGEQPAERPSLLRQLLTLAGGIVPLSPEEEAGALDQLVDMFPQYDRADLLRALRRVGSPERVAESILAGNFAALPRGGLGQDDVREA